MGLVLGFGLAAVVAIGLYFGSGVFSKDKNVIRLIIIAIPVKLNNNMISDSSNFRSVLSTYFFDIDGSVCCWYTTNQLSGICVRWRQLWSK